MARRTSPHPSPSMPGILHFLPGAVALLLYFPAISFDFTFDDWVIVARNPAVQEWGKWKLMLFSDYWPGVHSALYRPLTIASFALEKLIHGGSPAGFHFTNVLLHAVISVLVSVLAARLSARGWPGVLAGCIFAAHPIHSEVVSSIVGRAELLSSLLALSALILYLTRVRGERIFQPWYLGAVSCYLFSVGAKENVIVLPLLLLLWHCVRRAPGETAPNLLRSSETKQSLTRLVAHPVTHGKRLLYPVAPGPWTRRHELISFSKRISGFLAAAVLFLVIRSFVLGGVAASFRTSPPQVENPLAHTTTSLRILNALATQSHGLFLNIYPRPLIADYSLRTLPMFATWWNTGTITTMVFVIFAGCLWFIGRDSVRQLALGFSWYLLALIPASNLIFATGTIFAERLLYFPSIGLTLAMAWLLNAAGCFPEGWGVPGQRRTRCVLGISCVAVLALSMLTWMREPSWRDDLALFQDTVAKAPENVKARLWLGDALVRAGEYEGAIAEYRKALSIYPEYGAAAANLLVPLSQLHRTKEAIEAGERARSLFKTDNPSILYNLALAYLEIGDPVYFLDYMGRVLKIDPDNANAHLQLGLYYWRQTGDRQAGREHFAQALRLDPNLPEAGSIRYLLNQKN